MLDRYTREAPIGLRAVINDAYRMPELSCISALIEYAKMDPSQINAIQSVAEGWVKHVRLARKKNTGIDSFLTEYSLTSQEGIALMCLAEALLRIPDKATIDSLIKDKLLGGNWSEHTGQSDSFFVNATTWALMLTGKILNIKSTESILQRTLVTWINRSSEGVIRKAVDQAMRIMGKQFVMGRTIKEALTRAQKTQGWRYSYDMLGEAALTAADASRYFTSYLEAIHAIGQTSSDLSCKSTHQKPGISIKLSALHPRYEEAQRERVLRELPPVLLALSQLAKQYDIGLTVDAEESERLDLSLDVIESVFTHPSLSGWNGFGVAVQSYQKRAFFVLDWLAQLARTEHRRIAVRLIKGAYWDSEIKKTQMQGLSDYPVFTRKAFTDVSFQACVKKILTMTDAIYPQFATHNAYSVAMVLNCAGDYRDFEFQCLHGMGRELYEQIVPTDKQGIACRVYAPVGSHEDLLPYLVRRLLENGANSSFVHRIADENTPIQTLIDDPVTKARHFLNQMNRNIPLPSAIFLPTRKNSLGFDLNDRACLAALQQSPVVTQLHRWEAAPLLANNKRSDSTKRPVQSPQQTKQCIGYVQHSTHEDVEWALTHAQLAFDAWSTMPVRERAARVEELACLLEENREELMVIACLEAGKTWDDALSEVREAIDFCRYYAAEAKKIMETPLLLHGYTGETNALYLVARGTVLCISPWNFPLAILVGQIVAALVTGNCVISKPAEQTSLMASFAVSLMLKAGIPSGVVQLLPGPGDTIGALLVSDARINAVMFTGSTQTATRIHRSLAAREGAIVPLIAETGGQNAMIVDSSALIEQVIVDVIASAFGSAGQRCSALRIAYVQQDIYPRFIELLKGAMAELNVGDPAWLETDIGPVIDERALSLLKEHVAAITKTQTLVYQCECNDAMASGYFMPPTAIEIDSIDVLKKEVFGPILHVIPFKKDGLDSVIAQINQTGYGLTLGIHSRINTIIDYISQRVHAGNCYVNRNMIGAVVGLQPFGGEGLSGTGPKAGGPYYLHRLCHERTRTIDTTASGGNASLMSLLDEVL